MRFPLTLDVVGVRHYYSPDWPNHIDGYIKEEPENPYDDHAIAVCASDGKKIGHIARESTSLVRVWAGGNFGKLKCSIALDISTQYNVYRVQVTIYDKVDPSYFDNPFYNKNIFIVSRVTEFYLVELSGGIISPKLTQDTDFVICDYEPSLSLKRKLEDDKYHFEILTSDEYLKKSIPEAKRSHLIYGRTVSPATSRDHIFAEYMKYYLRYEGADYRERYSKKESDVVVQWDSQPTKTVDTAINDGKDIIKARDLLPQLYDYFYSSDLIPSKANKEAKVNKKLQQPIVNRSTVNSKKNEDWTGCLIVALVIVATILTFILL